MEIEFLTLCTKLRKVICFIYQKFYSRDRVPLNKVLWMFQGYFKKGSRVSQGRLIVVLREHYWHFTGVQSEFQPSSIGDS